MHPAPSYQQMKVLITGASGFLGCYLVERLAPYPNAATERHKSSSLPKTVPGPRSATLADKSLHPIRQSLQSIRRCDVGSPVGLPPNFPGRLPAFIEIVEPLPVFKRV